MHGRSSTHVVVHPTMHVSTPASGLDTPCVSGYDSMHVSRDDASPATAGARARRPRAGHHQRLEPRAELRPGRRVADLGVRRTSRQRDPLAGDGRRAGLLHERLPRQRAVRPATECRGRHHRHRGDRVVEGPRHALHPFAAALRRAAVRSGGGYRLRDGGELRLDPGDEGLGPARRGRSIPAPPAPVASMSARRPSRYP